jgi:group I intron endonuclease
MEEKDSSKQRQNQLEQADSAEPPLLCSIPNSKKFHFTYITTNLYNGKQYVGDRSCDNPEKDPYLGSGDYFKNALKLYGKKNFVRKILEFFPTKQEAFNAQEKYIKEYNTLIPNGYNISPKGGHNCPNSWSDESVKKISKSRQGIKPWNLGLTNCYSSETLASMSTAKKDKKLTEKQKKAWCGGRSHSEESKKKISENCGSKQPQTKKKISNSLKGRTWEDIYGIEGANKRRNK